MLNFYKNYYLNKSHNIIKKLKGCFFCHNINNIKKNYPNIINKKINIAFRILINFKSYIYFNSNMNFIINNLKNKYIIEICKFFYYIKFINKYLFIKILNKNLKNSNINKIYSLNINIYLKLFKILIINKLKF